MNPVSRTSYTIDVNLAKLVCIGVITLLAYSEAAYAQLVFSGLPIESKKFDILVNEYGYSDSMLDQRWGFKGREYLSGEWAGAVYAEGGNLPAMTRWLPPLFVFPDRTNATPHFASKFNPVFMIYPTNMYGFNAYGSVITNADFEIALRYEMLDLGTNETDRLAMGVVPASTGGAGSNIWSGRYVFKQTYSLSNVSGQSLSNVRFYQFLHALQSTWAIYDNRTYGGGLADYHYSITQQGATHALHSGKGTTYHITDTLSFSSRLMPGGVEVGLFASTNHQSHWPESGTAVSVENNSLNGDDQIYTNDTAFVCGALRFDLGTLAPGASTNLDLILSVRSFRSELTNYPPVNLVVHRTYLEGGALRVVVEETTDNPFVSYALRKADDFSLPKSQWQGVPASILLNFPQSGWDTIALPQIPGFDQCYVDLGLTINETPF